jgi:hypothetical protein
VPASWKRDPPRGRHLRDGEGAVRAPGRDGRGGPPGFGDGAALPDEGTHCELRPSNAGHSRHGRGRSVCRWRRGSDSAGSARCAPSCSAAPMSSVRPDEDTTCDTPSCPKTCDNPGWSSLCLVDRGSSTRGLGACTPGPHLVQGDARPPTNVPTTRCHSRTEERPPTRRMGRRYAPDAWPTAKRGAFAPGSLDPGRERARDHARSQLHLPA